MTGTADPKLESRQRALAAADQHLAQAKTRVSLAVLAVLRRSVDAEQQVARALAAIDQARAALREVGDA